MKRLTTDIFITISKKIHGDKYDYSLVNYINCGTKVRIICPKHGIFDQVARYHMDGSECRLCVNNNIKKTNDDFIKRAKNIHGDKYDYSLVNYINCDTKVNIRCKEHGIFEQRPTTHLLGNGCSKCSNNFSSQEYFIEKAKNIHGDKYDYSLVNYINNKTKVKIICRKHGEFQQRPDNHIGLRQDCPKCGRIIANNKTKIGTDKFIKRSNIIHKNKYDYHLVKYKTDKEKVKIICPTHGVFKQSPYNHSSGQGCPSCSTSIGENLVRNFLDEHKIKYVIQKKFKNCKYKYLLRFDFYLPDMNTCIEFDGKQHHEINNFFGGSISFEELKIKDEIKNKYCSDNNIKLIRLSDMKNIENDIIKKLNMDSY